ncbi:hypothetical protein [Chitinophaga sp. MM2321]|uniref:hypothetical protein n=1 Tax=Chitinophaga sp. MM2321 TaxID=3137178 RepID=UPI0032D5A971
MATPKNTPGPLRDDELQPDDIINHQQQPLPPKGNQDEQSRTGDENTEDELLDEEADDAELDELLEEEKITDEDIQSDALEEGDEKEKGPMKG